MYVDLYVQVPLSQDLLDHSFLLGSIFMFCICFIDVFVSILSSFAGFFSYLLFCSILDPAFNGVFCISCCLYSFFDGGNLV
jgi:hypothetical protein